MEEAFQSKRDHRIFLDTPADDVADAGPTDAEIALLMGNHLTPPGLRAAVTSGRKQSIMKKCYDYGLRYNLRSDNDFTYNNGADM